ncbi:hypothetical protein KFL_012450015 [Klebsormidium nitens]|uniref:Uncharacterized protein n=1 Tax=Klebsormidium nitens TaxID=105231 RepID=A0A1Y1IWA3_KLENI|nr:hypothetical protein KFL_012450015 [Klebsormidium nitens]|eukprot:GAQ93007.1 hypothetical protein KFL_012450015 [Klebsormidium nitens]
MATGFSQPQGISPAQGLSVADKGTSQASFHLRCSTWNNTSSYQAFFKKTKEGLDYQTAPPGTTSKNETDRRLLKVGRRAKPEESPEAEAGEDDLADLSQDMQAASLKGPQEKRRRVVLSQSEAEWNTSEEGSDADSGEDIEGAEFEPREEKSQEPTSEDERMIDDTPAAGYANPVMEYGQANAELFESSPYGAPAFHRGDVPVVSAADYQTAPPRTTSKNETDRRSLKVGRRAKPEESPGEAEAGEDDLADLSQDMQAASLRGPQEKRRRVVLSQSEAESDTSETGSDADSGEDIEGAEFEPREVESQEPNSEDERMIDNAPAAGCANPIIEYGQANAELFEDSPHGAPAFHRGDIPVVSTAVGFVP